MKNNKELLTEFFRRKNKSVNDKMLRGIDTYNANPTSGFFKTTDSRVMRDRLEKGLGATISRNTVKSVASKSIKSFPIIVSDNVEPETTVIIKQMLEEQYAEYIAAAVSNMIIDLGDYESDPDKGNIAIQALDQITGADFDKERTAHNMSKSGFNVDDVFRNSLPFQLLRRESKEFDTGNKVLDLLLENAVIVDNEEDVETVKEFLMTENYEIISENLPGSPTDKAPHIVIDPNENRIKNIMVSLGINGNDHNYTKVQQELNNNVSTMLNTTGNEQVKDRFIKATFLLHSRRISGSEYARYLSYRLGIPVGQKEFTELNLKYPWRQVIAGADMMPHALMNGIQSGDVIGRDRIITNIVSASGKQVLAAAGVGAGVGAGLGALGTLATGGILIPVVLGAAGLGAAGSAITRKLMKKKTQTIHRPKGEGWERVEALINEMYSRQEELMGSTHTTTDGNRFVSAIDDRQMELESKEYQNKMNDLLSRVQKIKLTESQDPRVKEMLDGRKENPKFFIEDLTHGCLEERIKIIIDELNNDKEYNATLKENSILAGVNKDLISTTVPIKVLKKYEFDPKEIPDVQVVPDFAMKGLQAYGEVEYDKRNLKDRKYNTPLLMTIKFKERFGDDKFNDKELTAVIGILGVVTRIPSDEMEEILRTNSEGKTIKGIFGTKDKNPLNIIDDLIGLSKNKEMDENLPLSKDIWRNLEKVGKLAVANKLTGRQTGNVANAQIVFSQREVDNVKADGISDLLKNRDLSNALLKRYSALSIMVANDIAERLYIYDNPGMPSWEVVPYSAFRGKEAGDQLSALASKLNNYGGR